MTDSGRAAPPHPPPVADAAGLPHQRGTAGAPQTRRLARIALALGVAGVATTVFLPLGLGLDVAAVLVALRCRRTAAPAPRPPGAATAGLWLGWVGVVLNIALIALLVVLWRPLTSWADCMGGANTSIAEHSCRDLLRDEVEGKLGVRIPGLA